jgi:hypothetical protein
MLVAVLAGVLVALLLSWLVRKGRIAAQFSIRSRRLLENLAAVRSAQSDDARQTLLIRTGAGAIVFGLQGLLTMLALFAAVEAPPFLMSWGFGLHGTYLASLSIVLVLQAMAGLARRRG